MVKKPSAMWETWVQSLVGKIPCRRAWQPTPVFLPGESLWTEVPGGLQSIGWKELDRTEWLSTAHSTEENIIQCILGSVKNRSFCLAQTFSPWCPCFADERTEALGKLSDLSRITELVRSGIGPQISRLLGFPGGFPGVCFPDTGSFFFIRKIPRRWKWQPAPVFLPGKSHVRKSQVDYSPWGRKELDMT